MVTVAFVVVAFGWGSAFYGPPVYLEAVARQEVLVSGAVTLFFQPTSGP